MIIDFNQHVADYGLAIAIAMVAVVYGIALVWRGQKMTDRFTDYLMEVGSKQTEALVASANASKSVAEFMKEEANRADKRHTENTLRLSSIESLIYEIVEQRYKRDDDS